MDNRFMLTPYFLDKPSPELETLAAPGWKINQPVVPTGDTASNLPALHRPIAAFVAETVAHGHRPVSIAGDCCTTIGFLAGLQHAGLSPVLIWLDAHGDFNTWETTPSGFLGGMPLAMIVGRGDQSMASAVGLTPLAEERVILADGRDLDPPEKLALAGSRVHLFSNVRALIDQPLLTQPLYVHFDADIINPDDAPAMTYRAPGGPSAAELHDVFHALAHTGQVVAVSMTTWTPELDKDGRSRTVCMELLHSLVD